MNWVNDPPIAFSSSFQTIDAAIYEEEEEKDWRDEQVTYPGWISVFDGGHRVEVLQAIVFSLSAFDVDQPTNTLRLIITELPNRGFAIV